MRDLWRSFKGMSREGVQQGTESALRRTQCEVG